MSVVSTNLSQREELIAREKQHPYIPKQHDYKGLDAARCLLCQNIVRALDSKTFPEVPSNILFETREAFVFPNRYPATPSHSLYVPRSHTTPWREGITQQCHLETIIHICDDEGLIAERAHPRDGMSIPEHDHVHLRHESVPHFSDMFAHVLGAKNDRAVHADHLFWPDNTPFDTLGIERRDDRFVEIARSILENLEHDNQVFTIVYYGGNFLITPRYHVLDDGEPIPKIGGGVGMHMVGASMQEELIRRMEQFIPKRGEYAWEKYVFGLRR